MNVFFCFVLRSKDKNLMTNMEKTFALSVSVVLKSLGACVLIQVLLGTNGDKPVNSSFLATSTIPAFLPKIQS